MSKGKVLDVTLFCVKINDNCEGNGVADLISKLLGSHRKQVGGCFEIVKFTIKIVEVMAC